MNICVVGLGDAGLPLALQFARSGASVVVLDIDEPKVDQINCGCSYIKHMADKTIAGHPGAQYCPDGELYGFRATGVREDEGRFLRDFYPTEGICGGPGSFAFDPRAYPTERTAGGPPGHQLCFRFLFVEFNCQSLPVGGIKLGLHPVLCYRNMYGTISTSLCAVCTEAEPACLAGT